jgi:hypothetical protein
MVKNAEDLLKLDIDNSEFFDSIGLKSQETQRQDLIHRGKKAVSESIQMYDDEGKILSRPHDKKAIAEIAYQRTNKSIESMLIFIPSERPKLHWSGGDVDISYTPDKVNIDWETHQNTQTQYMPYSVRYNQG